MNVDAHLIGFVCFCISMFITGGFVPVLVSLLVAFIGRKLFDTFFNAPLLIPRNSAVIITGCSSGIGESLAVDLAKRGVYVFAGVRKTEDGENLKKKANKDTLIPIIVDIAKKDEIDRASKEVEKVMGNLGLSLFAIINNAGYTETSVMELISLEKLRKQYEVNVFGHVYFTNMFLPMLRKYKGKSALNPRVVFIGSCLGKITLPNLGSYCSTKHSIESISDSYRIELCSWNIDVICIEPGSIKTNFQHVSSKTVKENVLDIGDEEDPVRKKYQSSIDLMRAKKTIMDRIQTTTVATNDVIMKSLTEPKPRSRYTIGIDSTFLLPVAIHFPHRILDAALGRFFK